MSIGRIVPGSDYSAAAGKGGTLAIPPYDPLAVIFYPGLASWLSGFDGEGSGSTFKWPDRKTALYATRTQGASPGSITTIGGQKYVPFTTAGLKMAPVTFSATQGYHLLFVAKAALSGTKYLLGSNGGTGPRITIGADGSLRMSNTGTSQSSSPAAIYASDTVAILEGYWDPVNGYGFSVNGSHKGYVATASVPGVPAPNLIIGAQDDTVAAGLNGNIGEVVRFDRAMRLAAPDLATLQRLQRRFAAQYGITLA